MTTRRRRTRASCCDTVMALPSTAPELTKANTSVARRFPQLAIVTAAREIPRMSHEYSIPRKRTTTNATTPPNCHAESVPRSLINYVHQRLPGLVAPQILREDVDPALPRHRRRRPVVRRHDRIRQAP